MSLKQLPPDTVATCRVIVGRRRNKSKGIFAKTENAHSPYIHFFNNPIYVDSIQVTGHPDPILISSIVWLEGEANYTRIHRLNDTSPMVTQSLYWFEQYVNFIRVHRSAIINPLYVLEFGHKKGRSGWVRLVNDKIVTISRAHLESTVERLMLINSIKLSLNEITSV